MDTWLASGQAIVDAGGWAAFFALLVLVGVGLWRRWWVPGFWFTELEAEVKALRKTVLTLTAQVNRDRRSRRTDHPDAP